MICMEFIEVPDIDTCKDDHTLQLNMQGAKSPKPFSVFDLGGGNQGMFHIKSEWEDMTTEAQTGQSFAVYGPQTRGHRRRRPSGIV